MKDEIISLDTIQDKYFTQKVSKLNDSELDYDAIRVRTNKCQKEFSFWFSVSAVSALMLIVWLVFA